MNNARSSSFATFEEPDIVYWRLIGRVEHRDMIEIFGEQLKFAEGKSRLLLLIDSSRLGQITPEARRVMADGPVPGKDLMPVRGCAVFGASFHVRVLSTLIETASRFIYRRSPAATRFFDTEAEARAWLDERRKELLAASRI